MQNIESLFLLNKDKNDSNVVFKKPYLIINS